MNWIKTNLRTSPFVILYAAYRHLYGQFPLFFSTVTYKNTYISLYVHFLPKKSTLYKPLMSAAVVTDSCTPHPTFYIKLLLYLVSTPPISI